MPDSVTIFILRVLSWLSCGLNTLTGGSPYMSFSCRQHIKAKRGVRNLEWLVDGLFFWEDRHCRNVYQRAIDRYVGFSYM